MAPKKGKIQGKRNNIKIRSKVNTQKRGLKQMKKNTAGEKPLENLKWLNKSPANGPGKGCSGIPDWLNRCVYKQDGSASCSTMGNSSEQEPYAREEDKTSSSDLSDECNCKVLDKAETKSRILKRKSSSTSSLVAKYIKSGMNHVASFIVESALRFGEEHGVVVPDETSSNVYELTTPETRSTDEKIRRIRFRVPGKSIDCEDAKKAMWKNQIKKTANSLRKGHSLERCSSRTSASVDSLEEILPLLEKLKENKNVVNSDLDLKMLRKKKERAREENEKERKKQRYREKLRILEKRYKSLGPVSSNESDRDYTPEKKCPWKKFKRDSLELGRQRLRPSTCPRKDETPNSY